MKKLLSDTANYPINLKNLDEFPPTLYIEGEILKSDQLAVAIVGTRSPTDYGIKMAHKFSFTLAKRGVTIISGMARGIDSVAHKAALRAGGRTIAVLGSGLDVIYPAENKILFNKIVKSGAVVSEFSPGTKPLPKNFLARNRIISGLSLAVLVVEGTKRSGTFSIAAKAANQNREVFAMPGRVDKPQSYAPHYLIENGAHIAQTPEDILVYLAEQFDTSL